MGTRTSALYTPRGNLKGAGVTCVIRCLCTGGTGMEPRYRGLHSSNFRLNVSAFCGIGDASRG
jgi:hypothetical protein